LSKDARVSKDEVRGFDFDRSMRLVSWNRSTKSRHAATFALAAPFLAEHEWLGDFARAFDEKLRHRTEAATLQGHDGDIPVRSWQSHREGFY